MSETVVLIIRQMADSRKYLEAHLAPSDKGVQLTFKLHTHGILGTYDKRLVSWVGSPILSAEEWKRVYSTIEELLS